MSFLKDNSMRLRMEGIANRMRSEMGGVIEDTRAGYDTLMQETLDPLEQEAATLRRKRGFRDPLAEFAMQSGLRSQQQGAVTKAQQRAGLRGASAFAGAQSQLQAAAQGYQMETSRRAQEAQRNSQALMSILSQQGQIRGNMGMAQMQAISGLQSQQVMGHAQMMTEAAKMADQPTFAAGLLGGMASAAAGGMFGGGAETFFGKEGFFRGG
tara:strand:- start:12598 stop:13230 length:633 start_codon:yes stop_codon:yes gene_type:complete